MRHSLHFTAFAAALALAACGPENTNAEEAAPTASTEANDQDSMFIAKNMSEEIKLDASSYTAFQKSLSDMKASLSMTEKGKLSLALTDLAKEAGVFDSRENLESGKSTQELLYAEMKGELDGLTYDEIIAKAG